MARWRGLTRPTYMPHMGIGTEPAPQPLPVPRPVQQPSRIMGLTRTQMILVVVVLLVLLYAAYRAGKANSPSPMQAVRKMSTNRLSKALYERLERNGRASDRTRAALAQLGR
jgi:hypothetical protein